MNAKLMFATVVLCLCVGCTVSESKLQAAVKNNPQVVFAAIEENPEQFIASVNKAAEAAQRSRYEREVAAQKAGQESDLSNPKKPKLSSERRLFGGEKAKIVIVEYADFQCPACGLAHKAMKSFLQKHPGGVQFYFKHMPLDFHKMARPAAEYFEAIRLQDRDKAAKFFDYVFENQRSLQEDGFLKVASEKAGADIGRLNADLKSQKVAQILDADRVEFETFGFTGTPVTIINGVAMHGAQSVEELERMVSRTAK